MTNGSTRNVWLYMVDGTNTDDLAQLDAEGFDRWQANRHTKAGDLILMYRTAPFSDIAYVFVARRDALPAKRWHSAYDIEIADGYRLQRVIRYEDLRKVAALKHWNFLKFARGGMRTKKDLQAQRVWPALRRIIEERDPQISKHFGPVWSGRGRRRHVFLSYAFEDKARVDEVYNALQRQGIDVWLDRLELRPATKWDKTIGKALRASRACIVCLSETWVVKQGYAKKELAEALAIAGRKKKSYLFPVMIDRCRIPEELAEFHAVRAYGRKRAAELRSLAKAIRHDAGR
jgi:TIR domain